MVKDLGRTKAMSGFVNTVLVSAVAFFGCLALLWYPFGPKQQNEPAASQPSIAAIRTHWGRVDAQTTELTVDLTLRNPSQVTGHATGLAYRATLGGKPLATGGQRADFTVSPATNVPVRFTILLPGDLVAGWFPPYAAGREHVALQVMGQLNVTFARGAGTVRIPWTIDASWDGHLAKDVQARVSDCDQRLYGTCIAAANATWSAGVMTVEMRVRNLNGFDVALTGAIGAFGLDQAAVAQGQSNEAVTIPAGTEAMVRLPLAFDAPSLSAWWPGHVARCESSTASLEVDLTDTFGSRDPHLFQLDPFETRFVCGRGA